MTALTYQFLNTQTNAELLDLEELCILNQDTETLRRIQTIKKWRNPSNRDRVRKELQAPKAKGLTWLKPEVQDIGGAKVEVSPFEGLYTI